MMLKACAWVGGRNAPQMEREGCIGFCSIELRQGDNAWKLYLRVQCMYSAHVTTVCAMPTVLQ